MAGSTEDEEIQPAELPEGGVVGDHPVSPSESEGGQVGVHPELGGCGVPRGELESLTGLLRFTVIPLTGSVDVDLIEEPL